MLSEATDYQFQVSQLLPLSPGKLRTTDSSPEVYLVVMGLSPKAHNTHLWLISSKNKLILFYVSTVFEFIAIRAP